MPDSPFIGGSYDLDSRPASVQRTVNMMPVPNEPGNERAGWVFKDVPGLVEVVQTIVVPPPPPIDPEDPPPHTCTTGPGWEQVVKVDKASAGMYYLHDRFVSPFFSSGAVAGGIMTSTDGETWTNTATFTGLSASNSITSVAYGNSLYVAYGNTSNAVWDSSDGVTFGTHAIDNVSKFSDPAGIWFGAGNFVICGANSTGKIWYGASASGMTMVTSPQDFGCGVYSTTAGKHFAGSADSGNVYSSTDLVTWTLAGTSFSGLGKVKKLAIGAAGVMVAIDGALQRNFVLVSTDNGATWVPSTGLPALAAFYIDVIYVSSQDLWLLTDANGYVYLSTNGGAAWTLAVSTLHPFLGDGQSWYMAVHPDGFIYAAAPVTFTPTTVAALGTC